MSSAGSKFGRNSLTLMNTFAVTSSAASARPPQYLKATAYTWCRCAS